MQVIVHNTISAIPSFSSVVYFVKRMKFGMYNLGNPANGCQRKKGRTCETTSLKLNKRKCASVSFEDIKRDCFKLLGTVVGPPMARLDFLNAAAASTASKLDQLRHLPHQHALILVRQCIQQDVRHLQRTLKTDDLPDCWNALHSRLAMEIKRLSAGRPEASPTVDALIKLPARFGSLGIVSHADCSPRAKAAAQDDSDAVLPPLLGGSRPREQQSASPDPENLSQAKRCGQMWKGQRDNLLKTMDDKARKLLVEAASPIGRKWISIIPYNPTLRLSDHELLQASPTGYNCPWKPTTASGAATEQSWAMMSSA